MSTVYPLSRSARVRRIVAPLAVLGSLLTLPVQAALPVAQGSQFHASGAGTGLSGSQTSDWTYTVGADEQLEDIAASLLAKQYTSQQLRTYNRLSTETALTKGDALRIPRAWLKRRPGPARAQGVDGRAQLISGATGRVRPLIENQLIRAGDEVVSHAGSTTIVLADNSTLRLGPDTRLTFNRLTQFGKQGMIDTRLRLQQGSLQTTVQPLEEDGSRFEIETPSALASVRGTAFTLQTEPGVTRVQVTDGLVAFGTPGKLHHIPAGYSATIDNRSPGDLRIYQRPPAPALAVPTAPVTSLPLTLKWAHEGADRYQLDLFAGPHGRWLRSETVPADRFTLTQLSNGQYQVEVAALSHAGVTGMPATASFEVELLAKGAQLLSPEDDASTDDDRPTFSWRFRGNNEVARVEIADGPDFDNLLATSAWATTTSARPTTALRPGQYYWRVATEAGGTSAASSATRTLLVNGSLPPTRITDVKYSESQVRIYWEEVDTTSEYLIQLSEDPKFARVVRQATVTNTTAALRLIPGRRYFVRVKAVSNGPISSRWGPGRELYID
ncbi:FecR domain-containing protein [Marinobacter sp. X15-166B]|uniref:FecR domain-containing protein n=1 Tax=Marinobacter sp. X15-166B TaxID=1897620 RepID=UPI00085C4DAE|nr:FecR domain-containing protein [Marinobacter sp. X15-166B]OEY65076.1 peptidoglycan-binding protein LysM [Marinobacter sp. X15-166B]